MISHTGRRLDTSLPFGLADGRGRLFRAVSLIPVNGHGELMGAEEPNRFRATLQILAGSLQRLGPFQTEEIDLSLLSGLLPLDRDFLLIKLSMLTFGNVQYQTVACPAEHCGERMDIQLDLSTVTADRIPSGLEGRIALPDAVGVRFRLPTVLDQISLHDVPEDELETTLLRRCLLPPLDSGELEPEAVLMLPEALRADIVAGILEASCNLDLKLDLNCLKCGESFQFEYDPVSMIVGRYRANRRSLLREVHSLAFYYHWSYAEILGLSQAHRREFLDLLEDELKGAREGLAL